MINSEKRFLPLLFISAILPTIIHCGPSQHQETTVKLDAGQKFQIMAGWEATLDIEGHHSSAFAIYKEKLLNAAVNDLGINRVRLEIKSGAENPVDHHQSWRAGKISYEQYREKRYEIVNDDSDPLTVNPDGFQWSQLDDVIEDVLLPLRKRVMANGESLWINVCYVDFGSSEFEHKATPEEYAEFVLSTYRHMLGKYGLVPDSWQVILEPDNAKWSTGETALAVKAAGDLLAANNFKPSFVVPSTTNAANAPAYIDRIAETPGAMQYVSEFSYHRYRGASNEVLKAITDRAVKYGKQTAMLEWIGADYKALHEDLKLGRNASWQQYTLAVHNQPDNGAQYFLLNDEKPKAPTLTMGSRTEFLRQYFRQIRSGAQRIGAETTNANFDPLAFINTDGKYVLVVKATAPGIVSVQNLPAGTFGISYTTLGYSDVSTPDVVVKADEALNATIPSAGVLTVYAKSFGPVQEKE